MNKYCYYCGGAFIPENGRQVFCCKQCHYHYYHSGSMVLTLNKKWFDMILSGVKTEEYRIIKPYWTSRFEHYFGKHYDFSSDEPTVVWNTSTKNIVFRNGYGTDKPSFTAEVSIRESTGNPAWGAKPGETYYVLKIHRIFDVKI